MFKVATEDWEFEQIHRLNYRTFVEEIPQHQPSAAQRLVDKFHAENTYLICLGNQKLVGMLAVRGQRPFSLDQKVPNLDSYLPPGRTICEIRLLAIEKKFRGARGGQVLSGILALLWQHGVEKGYDLAIISGTTRQAKLYQHLGFVPFGPLVGSGDAQFQPMYVTLETFEVTAREFLRSSPARSFHPSAVNFMPGPVAVRREVRRAFEQAPESHRSDSFKKDFQATKQILCDLVRAQNVELFMGSGTLANDVVAGQLSLLKGRGLILSNGEFGSRLADQARRFKLEFDMLEFDWGRPLDMDAVREKLSSPVRICLAVVRALRNLHGHFGRSRRAQNHLHGARRKIVPRLHQHHRHAAGGLGRRLFGVVFQRQGVARVSGADHGFLPSPGRARTGQIAPLSRPRLLREGKRHPVHVFIEFAARAARRGETRGLGKTFCPDDGIVRRAAPASGGNGFEFDW